MCFYCISLEVPVAIVGGEYISRCDWYAGRFFIEDIQHKNVFNIHFFDEEEDHCGFYDFDYDDLIALLKMEKLIGAKILPIKPTAKDSIDNIEHAARKCLNDAMC